MKTYKKGISLIVLVITIIVLSILAATVVISISNANIMSNAEKAVFKSDMANFKDTYDVYIVDKKIENFKFKEESLNLTYASNPDEFINIFGNNVPDKYIEGLEIKKGRLVYNTDNEQELKILEELGMVNVPDPIITLNQREVSISIDEGSTATHQLTATLTNATGTLTWESSNEEIAEVSSSGLITAKAVGSTIITVSYKDIKATCTVTVTLKPVVTLSENTVSLTIDEGSTATHQLTATLTNATGTISWTSLNESVATVDSTGLVTVKAGGSAVIEASYGETKDTCTITVTENTKTVIPSGLKVGDLVAYTPTASATGSYTGATYSASGESTKTYTPGKMTWVYLGQNENGNALLTSQESTSFTMTIGDEEGMVTGPDRMDELCNTLYGNSTYGVARNMKLEDVNRVLGYNGAIGGYYNSSGTFVETTTAKTIGELETELETTLSNRQTPSLSATVFQDYVSNYYYYTGTTYKADTTNEYKVIFKKADGTTNQSGYWLSSASTYAYFSKDYACFSLSYILNGEVNAAPVFLSNGEHMLVMFLRLRPVIVLNTNIQFGEKNSSGAWTLVET